ncbi:hypothetical protein SLEP1_g23125 [Rubroshorea leprosula]|uniref:Uncharacterized protein n=1 Tax=Rubroshorea leprosula TaxID=152421 RepID=A0AAV5JHJ6_9ROSI|nr:hypothetical protein SLEP1_g23125 [Rubroshorea leprosula]
MSCILSCIYGQMLCHSKNLRPKLEVSALNLEIRERIPSLTTFFEIAPCLSAFSLVG